MKTKFYAIYCAIAAIALVLPAGTAAAQETVKPDADEKAIKPVEVGQTPNLRQKGEDLYFAGQPSQEDLRLLRERGVTTIINLRTQPEMDALDFNEAEAAEELGMKYMQIPVTGEGATPDAVEKVRKAIEESMAQDQPVLLHCGSGNRVGYVWALVQGAEGADADAAIAEGKAAGMTSPALEENARKQLADDKKEPK